MKDKNGNWEIASWHTDTIVTRVIIFRMLLLKDRADVYLDDGLPFIVRSYAYWQDKLAISNYQLKMALKTLRRKGLIQTQKRMAFGKTLLHLRLGPAMLNLPEPTEGPISPDVSCEYHPTGSAIIASPYKKGFMKGSMKEQTFGLLEPDGSGKLSNPNLEDASPTFDNARKTWCVGWNRHREGRIDGFPQSPKCRRMFRDWKAKVPPDVNPLKLIAWSVENWGAFRDTTKSRTGKWTSTEPDFYQVMWNLPSLLAAYQGEFENQPTTKKTGPTAKEKWEAMIAAEKADG